MKTILKQTVLVAMSMFMLSGGLSLNAMLQPEGQQQEKPFAENAQWTKIKKEIEEKKVEVARLRQQMGQAKTEAGEEFKQAKEQFDSAVRDCGNLIKGADEYLRLLTKEYGEHVVDARNYLANLRTDIEAYSTEMKIAAGAVTTLALAGAVYYLWQQEDEEEKARQAKKSSWWCNVL